MYKEGSLPCKEGMSHTRRISSSNVQWTTGKNIRVIIQAAYHFKAYRIDYPWSLIIPESAKNEASKFNLTRVFVCRLAVNLQTGPRPHEYVYNHGTVSRNTLKTWCMRHSIGFVDLHNYICATSVNKSLLLREFPVKPISGIEQLTQPMDPEKKCLNFIFPTKYVIRKSLKFSHWPSKKKTPFFCCSGTKELPIQVF